MSPQFERLYSAMGRPSIPPQQLLRALLVQVLYTVRSERLLMDPLRAIRTLTDDALRSMSPQFERLYSAMGRPSIPPQQLLRALLVQVLYTVRSERLLMEELEYNLLFRWFVGLTTRTILMSI